MYYRRDQKEVSGIAHRLQFHFRYYEPKEEGLIPMALEDGGKGAIEAVPVAEIPQRVVAVEGTSEQP